MGILITGAGTIGCQVARSAVENNRENVVLFDIAPSTDFIISIAGDAVNIEQGSTLDFPRLLEIINKYGIDRIVHTATLPQYWPNLYETINVNIMGCINIFEASRLLGVERIINSSSAGMYDFSKKRPSGPISEDWPIANWKDTAYYTAKIATEASAENYAYKFGLDIINLRLGANFGPSLSYNMPDKTWLYDLIRSAYIDRRIKYKIMETRRLCWTYAKNTGDCLEHIIYSEQKPKLPFYICANSILYGVPEMIESLQELIPDLKVEIDDMRDVGWKYPWDTSHLENDFGFRMKHGPKEALSDFINWMRNNHQFVS